MTSADPDQIRRDIDRTRAHLSANVDTLAHEANPSTIARRKVSGVTGRLGSMRDRVMGTAQDVASSASDTADSATSGVADAVRSAPDAVQSRTQGSPLAAGLIAFGAGLLVSAMFPPTEAEQQAASRLQEAAQPLADEVSSAAQDVAGSLQDSAQDAVQSVKETAGDAASTVADEGKSAAQDTRAQARHAADTVTDEVQS